MKTLLCSVFVGLLCLLVPLTAGEKPIAPKVQLYSHAPGKFGELNTLICHVSGFHPPQIEIELRRNDQVIPDTHQTDLAFEEDWYYHLTKDVGFTPKEGDKYTCKVTHMGKSSTYIWEDDM